MKTEIKNSSQKNRFIKQKIIGETFMKTKITFLALLLLCTTLFLKEAQGQSTALLNNYNQNYYLGWEIVAAPIPFKIVGTPVGSIDGNAVFFGTRAGIHTIPLGENIGLGYEALFNNSSGFDNIALGHQALWYNTEALHNIAICREALYNNTKLCGNIAIGYKALYTQNYAPVGNTETGNIALGIQALYANNPTTITNGIDNTAVGHFALSRNTTGTRNTALGWSAGSFGSTPNTTGQYNTFIGSSSGPGVSFPIDNATAIGYNASVMTTYSMILGDQGVYVGIGLSKEPVGPRSSLEIDARNYITGDEVHNSSGLQFRQLTSNSSVTPPFTPNVLSLDPDGKVILVTPGVGTDETNDWHILGNTGTNDNNNFLGTIDDVPLCFKVNSHIAGRIDFDPNTSKLTTSFGYQALLSNSGMENTAFGYNALSSGSSGNSGGWNTAVGGEALLFNTSGNDNTAIGYVALSRNQNGNQNVATGNYALSLNTSGSSNTANGYKALNSNTYGNSNTAIGFQTLSNNVTGDYNTATGDRALNSNTGYNNTANGARALFKNTFGSSNTANGGYALYNNTTGNANTANGAGALFNNTIGQSNTANGAGALYYNTGDYNTAFGEEALGSNTTGNCNTAIGYYADVANGALTNLTNATAIGCSALATASDQVRLGDNNVTSLYCMGAYNPPTISNDQPNLVVLPTGQILRTTWAPGIGTGDVSACATATPNRVTKFISATDICNSAIYDDLTLTGTTNVGVDKGSFFNSSNVPLDKLQVAEGNLRVGEVNGAASPASDFPPDCIGTHYCALDYGRFLIFSGGSQLGSLNSENNSPFWIARKNYQISGDQGTGERSQFRFNIGNDNIDVNKADLLSIGTTLPGATLRDDKWHQHMVVSSLGNVGIGSNFNSVGCPNGDVCDFTNAPGDLPYGKLEILSDNPNIPQLRITNTKRITPSTSIRTDFQTTASGNLIISPYYFNGTNGYAGKVGIGIAPQNTLDVAGTVRVGTFVGSSDDLVVSVSGVLGTRSVLDFPYFRYAKNGLTVPTATSIDQTVYLGQEPCKDNGGKLIWETEIPMNNNNLLLTARTGLYPIKKGENNLSIGYTICNPVLESRLDLYNNMENFAGKFISNLGSSVDINGLLVKTSGASAGKINHGIQSIITGNHFIDFTNSIVNAYQSTSPPEYNYAYEATIDQPSTFGSIGYKCDIASIGTGTNTVNKGVFASVVGGNTNYGVEAEANGSNFNFGVSAKANGLGATNTGVYSEATATTSNSNCAINAIASNGTNNIAVNASATGNLGSTHNYGIYASVANTNGAINLAGYFNGDVEGLGDIKISGNWVNLSDSTIKENIQPISNALQTISRLTPHKFNYKTSVYPTLNLSTGDQYGMISQEVQQVVPELVQDVVEPEQKDSSGQVIFPQTTFKGLKYSSLIPFAIQGIKELDQKVNNITLTGVVAYPALSTSHIPKSSAGDTVCNSQISDNGIGVGVGTDVIPAGYKLVVEGKLGARDVIVACPPSWPDYVFENNHLLRPLEELNNYVTTNKHLPGVPSQKEIEKTGGLNLGEMQTKQMEKIEELYQYIIEMNKNMQKLSLENQELKDRVKNLENK